MITPTVDKLPYVFFKNQCWRKLSYSSCVDNVLRDFLIITGKAKKKISKSEADMTKMMKAKMALSFMGGPSDGNKGREDTRKPTTRLKKNEMKEMNKPLALQVATQGVIKQRNQNVNFQEIHDDLVQKQKDRKANKEVVQEEYYVDTYRGLATQLGGGGEDLKDTIIMSGLKLKADIAGPQPGDPDEIMYLKQAEHLMRIGRYPAAMRYLNTAMQMNQDIKEDKTQMFTLSALAKCYLLMGDWNLAKETAERVLLIDKTFVKAIYAKAEALYQTCHFEHALVLYYRGLVSYSTQVILFTLILKYGPCTFQRIALDTEEFRLGVQKCRKTIEDAIKDQDVFKVRGIQVFFNLLRRKMDLRMGDGKTPPPGKLAKVTVGNLINIIDKKKLMEETKKKEKEESQVKKTRKKKTSMELAMEAEMETVAKERRRQKFLQMRSRSSSRRFKGLAKMQANLAIAEEAKVAPDDKEQSESESKSTLKHQVRNHSKHHSNQPGQACCSKRCTAEERARRQKVG